MTDDELAAALDAIEAARAVPTARPDVVHVRRRLARSTSTSFYLDRSNRGRGTFCGADETSYDYAWAERRTKHAQANACPACLAAIQKETVA